MKLKTMTEKAKQEGLDYEKLLMHSFNLSLPSTSFGADRKIYYLLHYIKIGFDLRETGYPAQFIQIRNNIGLGLQNIINREQLYKEEKYSIRKLLKTLESVWDEAALELVISKALRLTTKMRRRETEFV